MKKMVLLFLALTLLCFGFAGASADETYPEVTGHVTVAQHRTDLEAEFTALIAAFNEIYPNVTVEVETVSDYKNTMAVRIAGGEIPDILEMHNVLIPAANWPDYFASLEDCDVDDVLFKDYFTVDGVTYGACPVACYRMMAYNKELYAQAGIESVPTTTTEFLEAMEKLKAIGVIPITSQYNTTWTQAIWIDNFAASMHDSDWENTWADSDTPFSDEKLLAALDLYRTCVDSGYCEEDLMSSDWDLQAADFVAGTIGTYCCGNYIYGTMTGLGMDPDNIGFYAFPNSELTDDGNCSISATVDWAFGMSKDVVGTENYEAACALVNFLVRNFASYTKQIPSTVGAECSIESINELLATNPTVVTQIRSSDDFVNINNIAAITIGNVVQQYITAEDPAAVIDAFNTTWADARAEYLAE